MAGADMLCEYRVGVDTTGYMTDEMMREREEQRRRDILEDKRRRKAIKDAEDALPGLMDTLEGLQSSATEDGRLGGVDAVNRALAKVSQSVDAVAKVLKGRPMDDAAATVAIERAHNEASVAQRNICEAKQAADKAEEEERLQQEREKDANLRSLAEVVLKELRDTLMSGINMLGEGNRGHKAIKEQAQQAGDLLTKLDAICSREGGSKDLRDGEAVREASEAVDAATVRADVLQRFLQTGERLQSLKDRASRAQGHPRSQTKASEPTDKRGDRDSGATEGEGKSTPMQGQCAKEGSGAGVYGGDSGDGDEVGMHACLTQTEGMLFGKDLGGLSDGEMLAVSESVNKDLDFVSDMLDTKEMVCGARYT
ncbi:unnamed protein product [Discosporangium mesarthrocarpum]